MRVDVAEWCQRLLTITVGTSQLTAIWGALAFAMLHFLKQVLLECEPMTSWQVERIDFESPVKLSITQAKRDRLPVVRRVTFDLCADDRRRRVVARFTRFTGLLSSTQKHYFVAMCLNRAQIY